MKKTLSKNGKTASITFEMPAEVGEEISVCGDFNGWSPDRHRLVRRKGGRFSTTVSVPSGRSYRYRYLVDGGRWENDHAADEYVRNPYGGEDSVVHA